VPQTGVSNGWIAYSTGGQLPGGTDTASGSDIYLVREGGKPRLIAGRVRGSTRNVCPAFSPDGTKLAYGLVSSEGRAIVVVRFAASGEINGAGHITVPGPGPAVCVGWSSDGSRLAYLDGASLVVRGLDGSTPVWADGDPRATDFVVSDAPHNPLLSPAGDRIARLLECQVIVTGPDGANARSIGPGFCPYSLSAWSPDGRKIVLMEDVGGAFTMYAANVDAPFEVAPIVSSVQVNGERSWPDRPDVSWQSVYR
jgi:Tol biopolymer transport system component